MRKRLLGYVSCVLVAQKLEDLNRISDFSAILGSMHKEYEIIVCVRVGSITPRAIENICERTSNISVYEVATPKDDALISSGLELALGDWILELSELESLETDARLLFSMFQSDTSVDSASYQLVPTKRPLIDRILSHLASSALEVPVHTLQYMSRLTQRSALQSWNVRKLRSKVLRVAPQLSHTLVSRLQVERISVRGKHRNGRIGLRTIAYSSAKPLRWVSSFSLFGALVSVIISAMVIGVAIYGKVVPGWTTTNLIISGLSFLILAVLGILAEYIYQISATSLDQPEFRVVRETITARYSFRTTPNITESYEF
jgi:hypothetical protein